jgi:hypothetical protein
MTFVNFGVILVNVGDGLDDCGLLVGSKVRVEDWREYTVESLFPEKSSVSAGAKPSR